MTAERPWEQDERDTQDTADRWDRDDNDRAAEQDARDRFEEHAGLGERT